MPKKLQIYLVVTAIALAILGKLLLLTFTEYSDQVCFVRTFPWFEGLVHKIRELALFIISIKRFGSLYSLGLMLVVLGGLIFGVANSHRRLELSMPKIEGGKQRRIVSAFLIIIGLTMVSYQSVSLHGSNYKRWHLYLWLCSIAIISIGFALYELAQMKRLRSPIGYKEVIFLGCLIIGCYLIYTNDLLSWRFSSIGDEWGFYETGSVNCNKPFSFILLDLNYFGGGYSYHPDLVYIIMAAIMKVLGCGIFSWKASSVIITLASILPIYLLVRLLAGMTAAIIGVCIYAFAHYNISFSHIGYDNAMVIFPAALGLFLALWALRDGNYVLAFWSGLVAGLGYYIYHPSRIVIFYIIAITLFYLFNSPRRSTIMLFVIIIGFMVAFMPLLAQSNTKGFIVNLLVPLNLIDAPVFRPDWDNAPQKLELKVSRNMTTAKILSALRIPISFRACGHYEAGDILDAISGCLVILGFFSLLFKAHREPIGLIIALLYLVTLAFVAVINQDRAVYNITRLHILWVFWALFAGVAASELIKSLHIGHDGFDKRTLLSVTAILPIVLAANLYHHYLFVPANYRYKPANIDMKAAQQAPGNHTIYWISGNCSEEILMDLRVRGFGLGERLRFLCTEQIAEGLDSGELNTPCTFVITSGVKAWQRLSVLLALVRAFPDGKHQVVSDGTGMSTYVSNTYHLP